MKRLSIKKIWNKIKKFFNITIVNYKKNFTSLPVVLFFIVSALINSTVLRIFTVGDSFKIKAIFADVAILLLMSSFTFLIKQKNRMKYIMFLSIFTTFICVANSIYYTYYESFASISLLATSAFVVDVGDAVVENVLEFKDLMFLWQPIVLYYFHIKLLKKNYYGNIKNENKKFLFSNFVGLGAVILLLFSMTIDKTEWSRFTKLWNRESVVISFGVYTYQFNDIFQSLQPKINNLFGHDKALKEVSDYYTEHGYDETDHTSNDYTDIFKGKNVIAIHAESIQKIAMELSFNGEEVTPNLNKLASEGIFFSNFYSQVGVGTSSDTEFTLSTSLMPSSSGTVFVNYFDREYVSIQKLLKEQDYYVFSMHANTGDFWNRATMHENLGYDMFYHKSYYNIDETIGLGLSDKSFFKQSIPMIQNVKETEGTPFYTTMIMLTNHTPFSDLALMDEFPTDYKIEVDGEIISRPYLEGTTLGNYFRSVHYADQAIEEFINELDEAGLLDNTVIVIYGDHDARIGKKYYDILYNYDPVTDMMRTEEDEHYVDVNDYFYELNRSVPLIIWTKDKEYNKEVTTPMGMIDILPTLGNMLGVHSEYQLGHDVLGIKDEDNTIVLSDGSYITDKIYYNAQKQEIYSINGEAVDEAYISTRSEYASKLIEVSNYIITYDLIKEMKEKLDS